MGRRRPGGCSGSEGGPYFVAIWTPLGGLGALGVASALRAPFTWIDILIGAAMGFGLSTAYQSYLPMSVGSAWLSPWGAVVGMMLGSGVALAAGWDRPSGNILQPMTIMSLGFLGGWLLHLWLLFETPNPFTEGIIGLMAPAVTFAVGRTLAARMDFTTSDALIGLGIPIVAGLSGALTGMPLGEQSAGILGVISLAVATAAVAATHDKWCPGVDSTDAGVTLMPMIAPVGDAQPRGAAIGLAGEF